MTKAAIIIWVFTSLSHPEIPERMYAFKTGAACEKARTSTSYTFVSDKCVPYMEVIPSQTVPSWKEIIEEPVVEFDPTIIPGE